MNRTWQLHILSLYIQKAITLLRGGGEGGEEEAEEEEEQQ